MSPEDQALISQLSGAPAPQGAEGQPQAAGQPPAPPQPKDDPNTPTVSEEALAKAGAKDASDADPVTYKVKFGDQTRDLTEQQIAATFERYASMNHKWQSEVAPLKPVMELAQRIMADAKQRGVNASPADLAQIMEAATLAYAKNPQLGADAQRQQPRDAGQPPMSIDNDDLAKWEEENAIKLPPGFRETSSKLAAMENLLGQMLQFMQQGQQHGGQQLQQAQALQQDALSERAAAIRSTIGNNLAAVQRHLQLPDEAEQDFMQFAFSRGYTTEDFVNPDLALAVATDFKNNMNSPEMERLRAMAKRRQAFTGISEGSPSMSGTSPSSSGDPTFDSMVETALSRR